MAQFFSVKFIAKFWNFTKRYSRKDLTLQVESMKNISWYYNKSINWGDTSDFIANVENFFVCCDKLLEDTIQNNF